MRQQRPFGLGNNYIPGRGEPYGREADTYVVADKPTFGKGGAQPMPVYAARMSPACKNGVTAAIARWTYLAFSPTGAT